VSGSIGERSSVSAKTGEHRHHDRVVAGIPATPAYHLVAGPTPRAVNATCRAEFQKSPRGNFAPCGGQVPFETETFVGCPARTSGTAVGIQRVVTARVPYRRKLRAGIRLGGLIDLVAAS